MAGTLTLPSSALSKSRFFFSSAKNPRRNSTSFFIFNTQKRSLACYSSKKFKPGFMDQILDYIEGDQFGVLEHIMRCDLFYHPMGGPAFDLPVNKVHLAVGMAIYPDPTGGPKLRKWYGAPDLLPKDGSLAEEDDSPEVDEIRDAVLVTDGDDDIGQMVILSLIVKRNRVKALVKDKQAAIEAFGTYVEPIAGDAKDKTFVNKALRGVRAIICPKICRQGRSGILAMMQSNARKLAEQDESTVMASGIPYTIIRAGLLQNTPGGKQGFSFKEGSAAKGTLCKEDAAFICAEALDAVPQTGLVFEVVNGEEKVVDWKECFKALMGEAE
ncbi:hypothetical protein RJ641_023968 [Dillenia turbinata]|uniref:NAD(P)-binding domain-containing protein n=1 Tax=Dillenia turbinata TaxID=194707 RepID=A0AAN8UAH0_9MAGN